MGFRVWDSDASRPGSRSVERGRGDRPVPEDWEPDEMPIHEGFWKNYRGRLLLCGTSVVSSLLLVAGAWSVGYRGGGVFAAVIAACILLAATALPAYWYVSYRRLREKFREESVEGDESNQRAEGGPAPAGRDDPERVTFEFDTEEQRGNERDSEREAVERSRES